MTMLPFAHRPLPEHLESLTELALDLRWTGSQVTDRLWEMLDPEAWERTRNPYMILHNAAQARLVEASRDESLIAEMRAGLETRRRSLEEPGWFETAHGDSELKSVAYFSMEFGLTEALPIYSGGLGILAGDHLKTASDLGVPVTGIGLLYQQGYFRQLLARDGWQVEAYPYNDPTSLPITPVQDPDGGWLRVKVWLPGRSLLLRVWQARVGRVNLYLLDSNDPLNRPWDRAATAMLYATGQEMRLIQEIVLGFGGWRVLEELGIEPEVCHLNEGHAAFVVIARARSFMEKHGCSFFEALWATRAGNVFTTHTPVAAGFDRFDPELIQQYAQYVAEQVQVPVDMLTDLGREMAGNAEELLNMAYLAMRGCGRINAVSRLHGSVSRSLFSHLYPGWPVEEVPVGHVTNGVHVPSWDSQAAHDLWSRVCNNERWSETMELPPVTEQTLSDGDLWGFRAEARRRLVEYVRRRLERQVQAHGAPDDQRERAQHILDPNALTLGFARRFATYKRPNLLLHDTERLARLLSNRERPVQLIVAGKAHPADHAGKMLVQAMARFADRPDIYDRVVFLADYDMALTQHLVSGVDVWINTPRRPWEASGTSGMKVLVNGGLNLSERDGWWAEAYAPDVGWAIGDGQEHTEPDWDAREAEQLYDALEQQVVPEFFDRDAEGLPRAWVRRVRESMCRLTPQFSSTRMLQEYVENFYLPAARAYRRRAAKGARLARELHDWRKRLDEDWKGVRMAHLQVTPEGEDWVLETHAYLGDVNPQMVRAEVYADPSTGGDAPFRMVMERIGPIPGAVNGYLYRARVPAARPAEHYTPRLVPHHPDALVPLEASQVLWTG